MFLRLFRQEMFSSYHVLSEYQQTFRFIFYDCDNKVEEANVESPIITLLKGPFIIIS